MIWKMLVSNLFGWHELIMLQENALLESFVQKLRELPVLKMKKT